MNVLLAILEVMDKEPSLARTWIIAVGLGAAGFLAGRRRPWFAVPFVVAVLFLGVSRLAEFQDPYVGPAVRQEAGNAHVWLSYLAVVVGLSLSLAGAVQTVLRCRRGLTSA